MGKNRSPKMKGYVMKRIAITLTALMGFLATPVFAEIPPTLVRSNVVTCDGVSASGFKLIGGQILNFVSEEAASKYAFCQDVSVVPASVDVYDLSEVQGYLETLGITETRPKMWGGNEYCPAAGFNAANCPVDTDTRPTRW